MQCDIYQETSLTWGFPGGSAGKESACDAGDLGSIPALERSPGEGNGLKNYMDCIVHGIFDLAIKSLNKVRRLKNNTVIAEKKAFK